MTQPVVGRPLLKVAASEAKRNWPFVFGFGLTLATVFKLSTSLKPEDAQKSPFINVNAHRTLCTNSNGKVQYGDHLNEGHGEDMMPPPKGGMSEPEFF